MRASSHQIDQRLLRSSKARRPAARYTSAGRFSTLSSMVPAPPRIGWHSELSSNSCHSVLPARRSRSGRCAAVGRARAHWGLSAARRLEHAAHRHDRTRGAGVAAGRPARPGHRAGVGAAAASARLKMLASLPSAWREQADRVGECRHNDPLDWYRAHATPTFLREVAEAVWFARRISVNYESWRGATKRDLEPLGLVLEAGA